MQDQSTLTDVIYKEIPGREGYRVGTDGSVWTLWGSGSTRWPSQGGAWRNSREWKRLSQHLNQKGYLRVCIKGRHEFVHKLVLETFIGPCPEGMECRHFPDPTKTNNRLENLQWGTRLQNGKDKVDHGIHPRGERVIHAKLTADKVQSIRAKHESGVSVTALATLFGVAYCTIHNVLRRKTWKHI